MASSEPSHRDPVVGAVGTFISNRRLTSCPIAHNSAKPPFRTVRKIKPLLSLPPRIAKAEAGPGDDMGAIPHRPEVPLISQGNDGET
jgi:hypothetical protein